MYNGWAGTELAKGKINAEKMLLCLEVVENGFAVRRVAENDRNGWKTKAYPDTVSSMNMVENMNGRSPAAFIDFMEEVIGKSEIVHGTFSNSMEVVAFICGDRELPSFSMHAEDSETFKNLIQNLREGQYLLELTWTE